MHTIPEVYGYIVPNAPEIGSYTINFETFYTLEIERVRRYQSCIQYNDYLHLIQD